MNLFALTPPVVLYATAGVMLACIFAVSVLPTSVLHRLGVVRFLTLSVALFGLAGFLLTAAAAS